MSAILDEQHTRGVRNTFRLGGCWHGTLSPNNHNYGVPGDNWLYAHARSHVQRNTIQLKVGKFPCIVDTDKTPPFKKISDLEDTGGFLFPCTNSLFLDHNMQWTKP